MTQFTEENIESIRRELKSYIPQLSINCVIFRFDGKALQVPAVRPINWDIWCIPGGYIHQHEDIDQAAKRVLFEQTQIQNLILSQFGTFGSARREFATAMNSFKKLGLPRDIVDHMSARFITIGYYSVVGPEQTQLLPGPFFEAVKWINVEQAGTLALDHGNLLSEALMTLRSDLLSKPLIGSFMPATFSIPELQKLYEAILGRPVDRGNFRQRILKSGALTKIGPSREKTGSRPPIIYKLNKEKYMSSLTQEVKLGF